MWGSTPSLETVTKAAWSGLSYLSSFTPSSSPETASIIIPGLEKEMDPLAWVVSVALRAFLADGHKPTLKDYHITWDPPGEVKLGTVLTGNMQGINRKGENSSRGVIKQWKHIAIKAVLWYQPSRGREEEQAFLSEREVKEERAQEGNAQLVVAEGQPQDPKAEFHKVNVMHGISRERQIYELFLLAIDGLEATKQPYALEDPYPEKLIKKLDRCKEKLEAGFEVPSKSESLDVDLDFIEALKWQDADINTVYRDFKMLQSLSKKTRGPFEQRLFEETINAIKNRVKVQCTKYAIINDNRIKGLRQSQNQFF